MLSHTMPRMSLSLSYVSKRLDIDMICMRFSRYVSDWFLWVPVLCSEGVPHTFFKGAGSHLLSHTVSSAVPSAALVLTIVFGMGTGVSPERIATSSSYPVFETYKPMPDFHSLPPLWLPVLFRHYLITKQQNTSLYLFFLRKEVIQPHLPIRLPCYDFTPVISPAFGSSLRKRLGH